MSRLLYAAALSSSILLSPAHAQSPFTPAPLGEHILQKARDWQAAPNPKTPTEFRAGHVTPRKLVRMPSGQSRWFRGHPAERCAGHHADRLRRQGLQLGRLSFQGVLCGRRQDRPARLGPRPGRRRTVLGRLRRGPLRFQHRVVHALRGRREHRQASVVTLARRPSDERARHRRRPRLHVVPRRRPPVGQPRAGGLRPADRKNLVAAVDRQRRPVRARRGRGEGPRLHLRRLGLSARSEDR